MSDGGKGDKPRPIVDRTQYEENFERIFGKTKSEAKRLASMQGSGPENYQDFLSTEDCVDNALEEYKKQAQELWNDSCTSHRSKK